MDLSSNNWREFFYRTPLPGFWRWWMEQLAALVPAGIRAAFKHLQSGPVAELKSAEVVFFTPLRRDGTVLLEEVTRIKLGMGEPADVVTRGRAAVSQVGGRRRSSRFTIALAPEQVLRKTITLPMAVEQNLQQTLAFELDRLTPFRPDQVYFDAMIIGRDYARGQIHVDWVAALRSTVDDARRLLESWGAQVAAVVPGPVGDGPKPFNLVPEEYRLERSAWRTWRLWVPLTVLALLLSAVAIVPIIHQREYAIALNAVTERVRQQATGATTLRQQLEKLQSDFNFILLRKYSFPSIVQTLNDVTRILPDDTWLTQLEIKTSSKGKDPIKELLLRGESANAGKLIALLEGSKMVEQAAPRSPTTKIQPGPGELFDLGAQLRPLTPPAAVELAIEPAADSAASPAADAATRSGAAIAAPSIDAKGSVPGPSPTQPKGKV